MVHGHLPLPQQRHERGVPGEDADEPVERRDLDGGGLPVVYRPVGTGGTRIFAEGKYVSVSTPTTKTNFLPIRVGVRFGSK